MATAVVAGVSGTPGSALTLQARALFERIRHSAAAQREAIGADLADLSRQAGLAWALRALFRQQVETGYVLFDPADPALLTERRFALPDLGMELRLQWNPQRELRLDPALLIERGVVARIDPERLINRTDTGGCYLCAHNIALQSPAEVLLPLTLAGEPYLLGANFVPITSNHFTVMSAVHRPQRYHAGILRAGFALAEASGGSFRVLFNGRAGASILAHEHLHATDTHLPVEALAADAASRRSGRAWITRLRYPLPLWLIESSDVEAVMTTGHRLIEAWQRLDPARHSENLLMTLASGRYRLFMMPRDLQRLTAPGRSAAMAGFETAGLIVLSHASERDLFQALDADGARQLLAALTPADARAGTLAAAADIGF